MNLERFNLQFVTTADEKGRDCQPVLTHTDDDLVQLFHLLGGKTFNHGLYRVLRGEQVSEVTQTLGGVFPEFRGQITAFGFDWLGRYFAVQRTKRLAEARILMLESGAGEAMEIPASVAD